MKKMKLHSLDAFLREFNIEIDYNMPNPNDPRAPGHWRVYIPNAASEGVLSNKVQIACHAGYEKNYRKIPFIKDGKKFFMWEEA